jgi:hypothetical protein
MIITTSAMMHPTLQGEISINKNYAPSRIEPTITTYIMANNPQHIHLAIASHMKIKFISIL